MGKLNFIIANKTSSHQNKTAGKIRKRRIYTPMKIVLLGVIIR